ncbi:MAG: helix-turn-helix domain-containing protein [Chloroflexota bacterium]
MGVRKETSLVLVPAGTVLPQWLTLEQASRRLGIHPTTLRRWVSQGDIGVFLTPGGHRRFRIEDIERFENEHHHSHLPATRDQVWADSALARTRQNLPHEQWVGMYSDADRANFRKLGHRLIGLLLQFAVRTNESTDLLAEARAIGREHAAFGLRVGRPLLDMLRIIGFFRTTMLEVSILQLPDVTAGQPEASISLLRRIEQLVDEVQTGVVESYQSGE